VDKDELRSACLAYEERNGIDCFLETLADIVADLLAENGLPVAFDEDVDLQGANSDDMGADGMAGAGFPSKSHG
jgi:hypothetical protein